VKCLNGDWCKRLAQFMDEFARFGPVGNIADDVSSLGQQARMDEVRAEDITQLWGRHGHQLDNKDLEEMAKPTEGGDRKRRTVSSKMYENQ